MTRLICLNKDQPLTTRTMVAIQVRLKQRPIAVKRRKRGEKDTGLAVTSWVRVEDKEVRVETEVVKISVSLT